MSTIEKFLTGVLGIALVATLVMNGKNTATAVTGIGSATSGLLSTAMGKTSTSNG